MTGKFVQIKNILILIFVASLLGILVSAHSLFLFNINLDFDKELKSNVIKSAQEFLNISNEPIGFDLDKGLIIVHFEPEQRHYVEINPLGYIVQGTRNENLRHNSGTKTITKEQGLEIAKRVFDNLPDKVKVELKHDSEISEVDNTFFYKWFRHVDGILVAGEDFMANVDVVNGNVIAYRLAIFDYPKSLINTTPAITKNVAEKVAELTFNLPSVPDFAPYLIVNRNELVWVNRLQGQFYPFYVGVNAKDGIISFEGALPGDVPKSYNAGDEIQVAESDLIKNIYGSK